LKEAIRSVILCTLIDDWKRLCGGDWLLLRFSPFRPDRQGRFGTTHWKRLASFRLPGIASLHDGGFLLLGKVDDQAARDRKGEMPDTRPSPRTGMAASATAIKGITGFCEREARLGAAHLDGALQHNTRRAYIDLPELSHSFRSRFLAKWGTYGTRGDAIKARDSLCEGRRRGNQGSEGTVRGAASVANVPGFSLLSIAVVRCAIETLSARRPKG
jgi:hypothetical protein